MIYNSKTKDNQSKIMMDNLMNKSIFLVNQQTVIINIKLLKTI